MTNRNDDELLRRVRNAILREGDNSPDLVDMVMVGYDLTMTDVVVAEVLEDPASVEVRSAAESRFFTCVAGGVTLRFELLDDSVVGEVEPAGAGRVTLQQAGEEHSGDVTDSGAYAVDCPASGPFRLLYEPTSGTPVVTEWILP